MRNHPKRKGTHIKKHRVFKNIEASQNETIKKQARIHNRVSIGHKSIRSRSHEIQKQSIMFTTMLAKKWSTTIRIPDLESCGRRQEASKIRLKGKRPIQEENCPKILHGRNTNRNPENFENSRLVKKQSKWIRMYHNANSSKNLNSVRPTILNFPILKSIGPAIEC